MLQFLRRLNAAQFSVSKLKYSEVKHVFILS
jgi:hypothetical protein